MSEPPSGRDGDPRPSSRTGAHAPRSSSEERPGAEIGEEPETSGTVFLTLVLLMLIFGFWVMMYVLLIDL